MLNYYKYIEKWKLFYNPIRKGFIYFKCILIIIIIILMIIIIIIILMLLCVHIQSSICMHLLQLYVSLLLIFLRNLFTLHFFILLFFEYRYMIFLLSFILFFCKDRYMIFALDIVVGSIINMFMHIYNLPRIFYVKT